jgi:6-phosphogluconolactonase (cycloisomerase 2 family)
MSIEYLRFARYALTLLIGTALVASCGGSGGTSPAQHTIGVTVGGLVGSGLVLQDNGGNDLAVAANGSFVFSTAVASGSAYAVAVKTQPTGPLQTCVVANAAGTVGAANVANVAVTCATNTYTVGGSVGGLIGSGLVLQDNGGNDLAIAANGSFVFSAAVASGSGYTVTIKTQPTSPSQTCVVANGVGTVGSANIANVAVTCTTNTYLVSGSVGGLIGSGLVLQDNGGNDLAVAASGSFVFSAAVASGSGFAVTIETQPSSPSQTCVVANAAGMIGGANVANVAITCTTNTYAVGGSAGGVIGSGLTLQDNGGNDLAVAANGSFVFSTPVASGSAYVVTIKTQPTSPLQTCVISSEAGTVSAANIANVAVTCTIKPGRFAYVPGGSIYCYAVNAVTGALAALASSPCDSGTLVGVGVDPAGRFAYATHSTSNEIRAYTISDSTGSLSAIVGSQLNGGGINPVDIAVDPLGQFVYMANYGGSVSAFTINSVSGGLAAVSGSPFPTAPALISGEVPGANSVTVDPTGKFLYVAINQGNDISGYLINSSTGALTPISGSPFSAGSVPMTVRVDPSGRYAYVTNANSNNLSAYSINSTTGALTPIAGSPFSSGGSFPTGLAIDPSGGFIFVTNSNSNTVSAFSIDSSTGVPTPISGSPFASGASPIGASVHASGKFLYVSNNGAGTVSAYAIDSTNGSLTSISGSPFAASGTGMGGTYAIAISD